MMFLMKFIKKLFTAGGLAFKSEKELITYRNLKKLESEGKIVRLIIRPKFIVIPNFETSYGKRYKQVVYTPSFSFHDIEQNRYRIIDVSKKKTRLREIKKKLLAYYYKEEGLEVESELKVNI